MPAKNSNSPNNLSEQTGDEISFLTYYLLMDPPSGPALVSTLAGAFLHLAGLNVAILGCRINQTV
jgi:hypothetical protein